MFRKFLLLLGLVMILIIGVSCSSRTTSDTSNRNGSSVAKENAISPAVPVEEGSASVENTSLNIPNGEFFKRYVDGTAWVTEEDRDYLVEATFNFKSLDQKTMIFQYTNDVGEEDQFSYFTTNFRGDKVLEYTGYAYRDQKLYSFVEYQDYTLFESYADCTRAKLGELQSSLLLDFGKPVSFKQVTKVLDLHKSDIQKIDVMTEDNYNYEIDYFIKNAYAEDWIKDIFSNVNGASLQSVENLHMNALLGDFMGSDRVYIYTLGGNLVFDVNGEKIDTEISIKIQPLDNMSTPYKRLEIFTKTLTPSENVEVMLTDLWKALDREKKESSTIYYN